MPLDLTAFAYFAPVLAFLVVFMVIYAILAKSKILGKDTHHGVLLFMSFLVATIFISAAGLKDYVLTITPWFAALIVSLFFIIFLTNFAGIGDDKNFNKGLGVLFIVILIIVFLVSGFIIFSESIIPFLPGGTAYDNPDLARVTDSLFSSRITGAILLIGISALVSWVLVKAGKDKKED